jgi:PAP2 superfamily
MADGQQTRHSDPSATLNAQGTPMSRLSSQPRTAHLAMSLAVAAALTGAVASPARAAAATPAWCAAHCADVITDWSAIAYQTLHAASGYADPMAASRVLAMMHLAMHDAANTAAPRYATYTRAPAAQRGADAAVAAAVAAHDVLAALFPKQRPTLAAALATSLADAPQGDEASRAVGQAAAQRVLARRADDGSAASLPYQSGSRPGQYRFTPGFDFIAAPHWRAVQPFALSSPSQFRVAPPPALGSAEYAVAYDEVRTLGGQNKDTRRSAEQTRVAAFWYEFSDIGWNRVARAVASTQRQDLWQSARTFALLNTAMADAYIAGWDSKFHYDLWRPVTAIRAGADDGNDRTTPDAGFTPYLPTPPVQDHPSTHSALGAAAATVLAQAFGRDDIRFAFASSSALPGHAVREFGSFSAAAAENADSRIYAGLHFRFATVEGLKLGRNIGRLVWTQTLQPLGPLQAQAAARSDGYTPCIASC